MKNKIIASFLLLFYTVLFALGIWQSKEIIFDNSNWLTKKHEQKKWLDYLESEYTKGEEIIFIVHLKEDFFQQKILDNVAHISEQLEKLPFVNEVQTPLNATAVFSNAESLNVLPFKSALKKKILPSLQDYKKKLADSFYYTRLIDKDFKRIAFSIKMQTSNIESNTERRKLIVENAKKIFSITENFTDISIVGEGALNYELNIASQKNLKNMLILSSSLILILLIIALRSFQQVFCILPTAGLNFFFSLFVIKLQGHPLTVVGIALPVLILVISAADSIHIVSRWSLLVANKTPRKKAITMAIRQTWLPCLGTSLTTAIGFGSFYFSELIPLKNFGWDSFFIIFVSFFLIITLTYTSLFICCAFSNKNTNVDHSWIKLLANFFYKTAKNYQKIITYTCLLLIFIFLYQLKNIRIETNFLDVFFAKKSKLYQDFLIVDKHLGGTGSIDIILNQEDTADFKDLSQFKKIKTYQKDFLQIPLINKMQSYLDPVQMVHKELASENIFPKNQAELEQELLFLEFSRGDKKTDVISPYISFDYSEARLHLQTPNLKSVEISKIKDKLTKILFDSHKANFFLTGNSIFFHALSEEVLKTQLISILITVGMVWLIFIFLFGIRRGSIGIIATIFPILLASSLIILLKIPFDFAVILIGSISFGLCVDDTIHLLYYYNHKKGAIAKKLKISIQTLSQPLFFTSILFSIGAGVFMASDLVILIKFGFFTCFSILGAFFSTLILLPSLLFVLEKK